MHSHNPLGIMTKEDRDIKPTRTIIYTKNKSAFKKLTKISRIALHKPSLPLGRALNPDELEQIYSTFIIPDDEGEEYSGPNYAKDPPPEKDAADRFEFDNVVEISDAEVKAIVDKIAETTTQTSDILYNQILVPVIAFDNARSIAQAVMRDNLNIKGKIDASVGAALDSISKLALISNWLKNMDAIPPEVKANYLATLSDLLAQNTIVEMNKHSRSDAYSAVLQSLVSKKSEGDVDADSKPMAALRKRSTPPNRS